MHQSLGPGLLESAYQICLAHELMKRGLRVACEVTLPVVYDGETVEAGCWLGYLLNWNTVRMKYGIRRIVSGIKPQ